MKLTIGKPDYLYHIERWLCSIEDAERVGKTIAFGVGFGRGEDGRLKAITNAESIVKGFDAQAQLHQSAERERVLREALEEVKYRLGLHEERGTLFFHLKPPPVQACRIIMDALAQSASKEPDDV